MSLSQPMTFAIVKPQHDWLKKTNVAFVLGPMDAILEEAASGILERFEALGHTVQETPTDDTDILLTTAQFGVPLNWRKSLMLTGRIRFKLNRMPTVYTLVHVRPAELQELLSHLDVALQKEPPDPDDFRFDGLAPHAYEVLVEQGCRGGPILALERVVQAQAKGLHILLVVGEDRPEEVYHFDLVGAYPRSYATDPLFYDDLVLRTVTTVSTHEVTDHAVTGELVPYDVWQSLNTPEAMRVAALELGKRNFFTDMIKINDLVQVPAVESSVASQYSEGCYATWEPRIDALIATITGSARPVDKDNITENELSILTGVRPDGMGAYVRHVEKKRNDPPSSEAVEMMDMDTPLSRIHLDPSWGIEGEMPVVRSKLHGHRGISSYHPEFVEYVALNEPYFHYLVSCATAAQAAAVRGVFAKSEALQNPDDPRQAVFTILPGHGLVIVEKWVSGKEPFQLLWEYMDVGHVVVDSHVPQGLIHYESDADGRMILVEDWRSG